MIPAVRRFAKGRMTRKVPGQMSGLELKYQAVLEHQKQQGEILSFRFEAIKLRLADMTWYTPDFSVLRADGEIELIEVKGSWNAPNQDGSRIKLKVAAETYPEFHFSAVTPIPKRDGGGWKKEIIS